MIEERNSFKKQVEKSKNELDKTMKENKAVVKQLMDKLRSVVISVAIMTNSTYEWKQTTVALTQSMRRRFTT